tara:strand:- start:889 stop:1281 length:393 start_codon:yes stop_codon:yes gene_type:complete
MSTIKVTNLQATGETASRPVSGVAAAWLQSQTTSASISDSFGVSSIDDDGTGEQGVNLTSAMSSANYTTTIGLETTNLHNTAARSRIMGVHSKTTTEVNLKHDYLSTTSYYTGGIEDAGLYNLALHGDLA